MHYRLIHIFRILLLSAWCIPLLMACSFVAEGEEPDNHSKSADQMSTYINLTVTVTGGKQDFTRAGEIPAAGENGDGREAGFLHENVVTGITLILYQDGTDEKNINTSDNPTLDYIKYYPVTRTGTPLDADGSDLGKTKIDETFYTTGNQLVQKGTLDMTKKYHAIIVANADLRGRVSSLNDVRAYTLSTLYSGDEKTASKNCVNFVMSSEEDHVFDFPGATPITITGGMLYSFSNIRIERMAARIDFWAAGATYNATAKGYEYSAGPTDKFVVTGLMPFNLMGANSTNGGEYLIKRVAASPTATTFNYLGDEGSNYVIDPAITVKTSSGELTYYKNKVLDFGTLDGHASYTDNGYYRSIETLHSAIATSPASGGYATLTDGTLSGEDVVICYPMENTLQTSSYLYSFATGVVIEGDYYKGGFSGTKTHRIYYGYLRHEGTATSYQARLGAAFELDKNSAVPPASPMEYGIVRNNIYRVYISSITPDEENPKVTLNIKVKKWNKFEHETIYM